MSERRREPGHHDDHQASRRQPLRGQAPGEEPGGAVDERRERELSASPQARGRVPERTLTDLGWPQLIEHLARRARTARGEAAAGALALYDDAGDAQRRIAEIAEARALAAADAPLPFGGIADCAVAVARADKGGALDPAELVAVGETARGLSRLRAHLHQHAERAPLLGELAAALADFGHVYHPILESFDPDGRLHDHASEQLGPLRRKVSQLRAELERRISTMVEDSSLTQHLRDRYYTQREDRYVVPVRVDARAFVRGIVHDTSQSGQTVFVEPEAIVDLNNRLKLAECDVADEERRILARLTGYVAEESAALAGAAEAATVLDVIAAGARLADDLDAAAPRIDSPEARRGIVLVEARHPLMLLSERHCVPNDIEVGPRCTLVVSGPNAGGKTVALKVVGMIALMVRAGLHVPAAAGSVVPWFEAVYADIGDAQSLERDLSTFSAHMMELRRFLADAGEATLLLIDEVAVGTEPEQGAALAQAVLEALAESGVTGVVTTHYERLKVLGASDERFANASVGFDLERMEPTFRLHLGVPGSSGALAVARRTGLPGEVVDRAEALLGQRRAGIEQLVAELSEERDRLARERDALAGERDEATRARRDAEAALERARQREKKAREGAHLEAVAELRRARADLENVRTTVKRRSRDAELGAAGKRIDELASAVARHAPARELPPGVPASAATLTVGTPVIVASLGGRGQVISPPERGRVAVRIGAIKTTVAIDDLLVDTAKARGPANKAAAKRPQSARTAPSAGVALVDGDQSDLAPARTPDTTVDVRGERVDEAVAAVDLFLDESLRAVRDVIFVIHGHGTGALRSAVRAHLEQSPVVSRWRAGKPGEGGDGITVAWLDVR